MFDSQTALDSIFSIAQRIYAQVQLVKANKAQCRRLGDRVKIIEDTVHGLDKIKDKNQYKAALNDLLEGLQEGLTFITKFSTSSRWQRWVLKAGNYKETFEELTDRLQKSALQLNLGLSAQLIVDREADRADQAEDLHFIQQNQQEIVRLNQQELIALQGIHLKQQEQQEVLRLQMAAIQSQLTLITQAKAPKAAIDEKHCIPYYDLVFEQLIAEGSFGKIYLGKWEGRTVAIKTLEGVLTPNEEQQFIREVAIMSRLRHPNITTFYGACLEAGHACLVMEYMEQNSLERVLKEKPLSPEQQKSMGLDILKGLQYLHNQGVLHRDLKSGNILVNAQGIAKLSDFGLSKIEAMSVQTAKAKSQALPWQAPEVFTYKGEYTKSSDIYSFGVILWEMVTGKVPVLDKAKLKDYAILGERQITPTTAPSELASLMKSCWEVEPTKRPAIAQVIQQLEAYQVAPPSPTAERYYELAQASEQKKAFVMAFQQYQKSAAKGHFRANTALGGIYLMGNSAVPKDKAKALECFLAAAKQGHVRAMFNAAQMLEYGDGVPEDKGEALRWYQAVREKEPSHREAPQKCRKLEALLGDKPQYALQTGK